MVQTAVPHSVKEELLAGKRGGPRELWNTLLQLTDEGLARHPRTDLVVWPETMNPFPYLESDATTFRAAARLVARRSGRPVVHGVNSYRDRSRLHRGHNAALLCDAQGEPQGIYRKQRLVPMGEEFAARWVFPEEWCDRWFDWLAENFGLPRSCDLEAGEGFATLDAGPGLRCAALICFEGLYGDLARGAVRHEDPDLILLLVNNGWFGRSYEQRQFAAAIVFRAVETRTPLLCCANAGITCAIAPTGEVIGRVDRVMEKGFLHVEVPARWPAPPCLRGGAWALPLLLALGLLGAWLRGRRRGS